MQCGGITISFKLRFAPTALVRPQQSVLSSLRRPSELKEHAFISPMWPLKLSGVFISLQPQKLTF